MRRRSSGGVSPVRTATLGAGSSMPAAAARRADAGERRAQVALDVVVERLERRDVEHAQALARLRHEAVEEPQERGERLARARRRAQRARARPRRSAASPASAPASARRGRPRTSAARAARTRRARRRWRWTSPRTIRPTRARASAQQQVEREQCAGRRRPWRRRASRARRPRRRWPRPAARARSAARRSRTPPARRAASDRRGVGIRGPEQQRRHGPDDDVLGAPGTQREPREHERRRARRTSGPVRPTRRAPPAATASAIAMTSARRMARR